MTRMLPAWRFLLLVVVMAMLLLSAAPRTARAQGEIQGALPASGGFALVTWTGGPVDDLVAAAATRGCRLASAWTSEAGRLTGMVVGAPEFANREWFAIFPAGADLPATPLLLVCARTASVLGDAQIVALYGYPGIRAMGILGQYSPEGAADEAIRRAAEYDALNGDRGVVPAFEPIVIVAQPAPGADGSYVSRMPAARVTEYVEVARDRGLQVILDMQLGWADPLTEIRAFEPFLREPFVHVAIDPEYMTRSEGAAPGSAIGTVDAATVNEIQAYLDELVRTYGLPPKLLVIHQFLQDMIQVPAEGFARYSTVEIVIDMDGFGPSGLKLTKYRAFSLSSYAERAGLKLFLNWDTPLLQPAELQALDPRPDLVIYQ